VHRVGRTARANTTGVALTLINEKDMIRFKEIENLIEREVIKLPVPADIGESPLWNPSKKKEFPQKKQLPKACHNESKKKPDSK
jgi:ATP-dependent RNA helicase RhlE